jgi:parallel beta-helix repeat protein
LRSELVFPERCFGVENISTPVILRRNSQSFEAERLFLLKGKRFRQFRMPRSGGADMKTNTGLAVVFAVMANLLFAGDSGFSQNSTLSTNSSAATLPVDPSPSCTLISRLPYTISQSGAYRLATNLSATATVTNGIVIVASDVTLDLGGFVLDGGAGSGNGCGIHVPGTVFNFVARNGTVRNWRLHGINARSVSLGRFADLQVRDNGRALAGDGLRTGSNSQVSDCFAGGNGGAGIGAGDDNVISKCISSINSGNGIAAGNGCVIGQCTASGNEIGISVNGNSTIANCAVTANTAGGISCAGGDTVVTCTANGNGTGRSGWGIGAGDRCLIRDCTANDNKATGISVASDCVVVDNHASHNGNAGIAMTGGGNRIESNVMHDNQAEGILPAGKNEGNMIIRNFSGGNRFDDYDLLPDNNDYAPIASPAGGTNPFSNFQ